MIGGVWLLAWFGTGDADTDIVAHLTGFLAGLGLGVVLGMLPGVLRPAPALQFVAAGLSLLLLFSSWRLAIG